MYLLFDIVAFHGVIGFLRIGYKASYGVIVLLQYAFIRSCALAALSIEHLHTLLPRLRCDSIRSIEELMEFIN